MPGEIRTHDLWLRKLVRFSDLTAVRTKCLMARLGGLEPPAFRSAIWRSIHWATGAFLEQAVRASYRRPLSSWATGTLTKLKMKNEKLKINSTLHSFIYLEHLTSFLPILQSQLRFRNLDNKTRPISLLRFIKLQQFTTRNCVLIRAIFS